MKKLLTILLTTLLITACGKTKKESNDPIIEKSIKEARKKLIELPKIEKEISDYQKKQNNQKVSGDFEMTIDGDKLKTSSWNAANSAIRFYKHRAVFRLRLSEDNKQYMVVTVNCNKDLFPYQGNKKFAPSMYPVSILEGNLKQEKTDGYIQFNYYNDNTNEKYSSVKGAYSLEKLTDSELKLSFNGEMARGDWRQKNFVPASIKLNIQYNFLTDDLRKK